MQAVKRGGDRQTAHEAIRRCANEATAAGKRGEDFDLLARLAAEPALCMSGEELKALLRPADFIGRCPEQVQAYLDEVKLLLSGAATAEDITL